MSEYTEKFTKGASPADYEPNNIAYASDMIGKIAFQVIREISASNPLAVFDKQPVANGDTIEEAVTKLATSTAYDSTGAGALTRANPELAVKYYKDWTRRKFKTTVDISEIRKVLLSGKGANEISSKVVAELSEGDKQEKYEALKALLANSKAEADGGSGGSVGSLVNYATVPYSSGIQYKKILTAMKNAISKMKFVNATCNSAGLKRKTAPEDIVVLMPYMLKNEIDVEELAGVFNLDKAEIGKHIIEIDTDAVDDFNYIYIVDRNAILDYTRLYEMADQKNADGLFYNYFLHVERLFGVSQLFDAGYIKVGVSA